MTNDLKKIWTIFTPSERRKSVWMLGLVALMAIAETGGVLSIMPFLSVLGRPEVVQQNYWLRLAYENGGFHGTRQFLVTLGLISIVTVLTSSVFKTITLHLLSRFIHLLRHSISARLLSRYLHQPYEFFLTHNPSVLCRNVLSEVDQLLFSLIQPLSQLIAQGTVVLAILLLVFLYDPLTALAIIAVVSLLYGTIYGLVRKRLARIGAERQTANGQRFQSCNELLTGIKDIKATHAATAYQETFNQASRLYSRHMATSDTLSQSPLYFVEAVGYSGLILLALVLMLNRGDIAHVLPALGLYGFAAYRMLPSVQIMYRGFAKLRFSSAALDAIYCDLLLPEQHPSIAAPCIIPTREIRIRHVTYAYPSTPEKPVLNDLNLTIPVGTSVGIVGKTGAGKSTLMDILLGLLHPQAGTLSVDGIVIDDTNVAAWQRSIGYVPQHIYLADASVAENIAFGETSATIDMQALERAAIAAQIHDFIVEELPLGYETRVGDRGVRLSGGQRQRLGIARALYRDPPILFFDEATSALGASTEQMFNEAIRTLSGSRTIVVIAHKKASLRNCEQIFDITNNPAENLTEGYDYRFMPLHDLLWMLKDNEAKLRSSILLPTASHNHRATAL